MPRRRVAVPRPPPERLASSLETRWGRLTYTILRVPPRKLTSLAAYAVVVSYSAQYGLIRPEVLGKCGGSIVGVLSMVTGLLLSYRFSSAIQKWDEGKAVWSEVRTAIRNGVRTLSIFSREARKNPDGQIRETEESGVPQKSKDKCSIAIRRTDELSGLLVGFAFALQHHLYGTRPLPQPPLSDLLPSGYLSSFKRTESRVRFAEKHEGPTGSHSILFSDHEDDFSSLSFRSKTSSQSVDLPLKIDSDDDDWDVGSLRHNAEEAVARLSTAIGRNEAVEACRNRELQQQLDQLNVSGSISPDPFADPPIKDGARPTPAILSKPSKSNLHSPYPSNLPLDLLRLIEAYVAGLGDLPKEQGGWDIPTRERGLNLVKSLNEQLGKAERLKTNPPPLPLTLHLSQLLIVYLASLPCSLLCVVNGWPLVLITMIAGWCLLGLEALIGEVSGVFGPSENHHPLPAFTQQILNDAIDISPSFILYYRARLVSRVGETASEVKELDGRRRKGVDAWLPTFA